MESSDVIAFRDSFSRRSLYANADVRVINTHFDDVGRQICLSNGHLSDDENSLFVEAITIATSDLRDDDIYHVEVNPEESGVSASTRSEGGPKLLDRVTKRDEEGVTPDGKEQRDGSCRHYDGAAEGNKTAPDEESEGGEFQASLVDIMQRLTLSTAERPSPTKIDSTEEFANHSEENPDETRQEEAVYATATVLARGPIGGVAVAYPSAPLTCEGSWTEQSYPGLKRSQFVVLPEFAEFGRGGYFADATVGGSSFSASDDRDFQASKYRRGPQPVESDDLSLLDDLSLPLTSLFPKDIDEVLGADNCDALVDDFLLSDSFYNFPEQPLDKVKRESTTYSPVDQFQNGSVIGEFFPTGISAAHPAVLQHLLKDNHQQYQLQHPSLSSPFLSYSTDPITEAGSPSQAPTLSANPPGNFFQPGRTLDPTQFCKGAVNVGSCTGFHPGEMSPPESGFSGSDYSQSPHPSTRDSPPGCDSVFTLEPQENFAEIEAFLKYIEDEGRIQDGKQPTAKNRFPLETPPPGKRPPVNTTTIGSQLPPINHQPIRHPTNPPSTNYQFSLENSPASQTVGQFPYPPNSSVASFHLGTHSSSPTQQTFVSTSSPTLPVWTNRDGNPAEPTMMNTHGTISNVTDKHLKEPSSLAERKQLAKASSVIARLTRQQLVTPDSDQDTLLHLAIAKNERFLTEALISRLDRDKLTDSLINRKNKQGQTPLCLATVTNQWTLVRLLVDRGADVNVRIPLGAKQTKSFCNPVHFAASNGREFSRTLDQLLGTETIDLSALDSDGCSALHKAVMANGMSLYHGRSSEMIDSRESILQLVIHGIDISQQDGFQSKTALNLALERGDMDLFYYIVDLASSRVSLPLLLNARTGRRGDTLLHVAANLQIDPAHQATVIRQMVNRGANPQLRNWDNRLPWELATRPQIAELLKISVGGVGL